MWIKPSKCEPSLHLTKNRHWLPIICHLSLVYNFFFLHAPLTNVWSPLFQHSWKEEDYYERHSVCLPVIQDQWEEGHPVHDGSLHQLCDFFNTSHKQAPTALDQTWGGHALPAWRLKPFLHWQKKNIWTSFFKTFISLSYQGVTSFQFYTVKSTPHVDPTLGGHKMRCYGTKVEYTECISVFQGCSQKLMNNVDFPVYRFRKLTLGQVGDKLWISTESRK